MKPELRDHFIKHAVEQMPREACALLVVRNGHQQLVLCKNIGTATDQFIIDPEDYAKAEGMGEIIGVVHSHPNLPARASQADLVSCEASGLPWYIASVPNGDWSEIRPTGYVAPLVGREWSHGVLDCYSIICDWYKRERNIDLPDFERTDEWWLRGGNLYAENFRKAGFIDLGQDAVNELQAGDVILMQVQSPVANHGAIYLGDGLMLHHVQTRLSSRDVYGGYWLKNTVSYLRYEPSSQR